MINYKYIGLGILIIILIVVLIIYLLPSKKSCLKNCSNNGTCDTNSGLCKCNDGWAGDDCSIKAKPCSKDCPKNSTCDLTSGQCKCDDGWSGDDCSVKIIPCKNGCFPDGGKCDTTTGNCICNDGWSGDDCSKRVCKNNCSGHGSCNTKTGVCICDSPYSGEDCSSTCNPACKYGKCNQNTNKCDCNNIYIGGDDCGSCINSDYDLPDCNTKCVKANYDPNQKCKVCLRNYDINSDCKNCLQNYLPPDCVKCADGYQGDNCLKWDLLLDLDKLKAIISQACDQTDCSTILNKINQNVCDNINKDIITFFKNDYNSYKDTLNDFQTITNSDGSKTYLPNNSLILLNLFILKSLDSYIDTSSITCSAIIINYFPKISSCIINKLCNIYTGLQVNFLVKLTAIILFLPKTTNIPKTLIDFNTIINNCQCLNSCSGNGTCNSSNNALTCSCNSGFYGLDCSCSTPCVNGTCDSTGKCICVNGYYGDKCDTAWPVIVNTEFLKYFLTNNCIVNDLCKIIVDNITDDISNKINKDIIIYFKNDYSLFENTMDDLQKLEDLSGKLVGTFPNNNLIKYYLFLLQKINQYIDTSSLDCKTNVLKWYGNDKTCISDNICSKYSCLEYFCLNKLSIIIQQEPLLKLKNPIVVPDIMKDFQKIINC